MAGAQIHDGYRLLVVVALVWARRVWPEEEPSAVMIDAYRAVKRVCVDHWPEAATPVGVPVNAQTVLGTAWHGHVLRTSDADPTFVPDIPCCDPCLLR